MTPAIERLSELAQQVGNMATEVLTQAPMPLAPHTARMCQQAIRLSKGIQSAVHQWVFEESQTKASKSA